MPSLIFAKPTRRNRTTNKFRAKKTQLTPGGRWYDSKLEADYRRQLELMQRAGAIKDLIDQPQVYLTAAQVGYRPDFAYTDVSTGEKIFVECKGFETEGYRLKLKLWRVYGPGKLLIVKRRGKGAPEVMDIIIADTNKQEGKL